MWDRREQKNQKSPLAQAAPTPESGEPLVSFPPRQECPETKNNPTQEGAGYDSRELDFSGERQEYEKGVARINQKAQSYQDDPGEESQPMGCASFPSR
jgi:hypothetical protein